MPKFDYMNGIVDRSAPRWAWDIIDETLSLGSCATNFDPSRRAEIRDAVNGMTAASADPDPNREFMTVEEARAVIENAFLGMP